MSHRIEQINELLLHELATLVNREISVEGGLITITWVECSPDLRHAKVGVSVLPENLTGTALEKLRKSGGIFMKTLKKKLNIKYIPHFQWIVDTREQNAAEIEETLKQIADGETGNRN